MDFRPPPSAVSWNAAMPKTLGIEALKSGKVAVILLAGGTGSRLGCKGPKGNFPVTPARGRTLFQLFADKIDAASECFGQSIPVAVLTSEGNHEETIEALKRPKWAFHKQKELPYLDENEEPLSYAGPDGNGGVFEVFSEAGVFHEWKKQGITLLSIVVVDNALADPVEPTWIHFHLEHRLDISLKVVERNAPSERVGQLVDTEAGLRIIEYTEMSAGMEYLYGNTSLYLVTLDLALEAAKHTSSLPYHRQWKRAKGDEWGWKRERYVFDHFPLAKKIAPLLYPREETFVPLKDRNDLEGVQRALSLKERAILGKISEKDVPAVVIEIDPHFYYPTPVLLKYWRENEIPSKPFVRSEIK